MQMMDDFLDTLKSVHIKKIYQYHWDKFVKTIPFLTINEIDQLEEKVREMCRKNEDMNKMAAALSTDLTKNLNRLDERNE